MNKVLIVGNSSSLANYFSEKIEKVFIISAKKVFCDKCEIVDIRENSIIEILNFVLENDINLTVVTSPIAIKNDIATIFQQHNCMIFAPTFDSAYPVINLSDTKHFLYKMHAPVSRFAVFEKLPLAIDYLEQCSYPVVISNDNNTIKSCCTIFKNAKDFCEDLFVHGEKKLIIEDYIYAHPFTLYAISDGYHVLPLCSVHNFKFSENGDGGYMTNGVGSYVPDIRVPENILSDVFDNVISKYIISMQNKETPYVGILGVSCKLLNDNSYIVLSMKSFFDDVEIDSVLNYLDEDLYELFMSCANGSFADEYDDILINDNYSVSCLISSRKSEILIPHLDLIESKMLFLNGDTKHTVSGENFVITSCAKTLSRAKNILKDDIDLISFNGMKCRSDIYN